MIFVFSSNLLGKHGRGAALHARKKFGAIYGQAFGRQGDSFAIPTKDERFKTLPLHKIRPYVNKFLDYARENPELQFQLTAIGCGLAGYAARHIAPMFKNAPKNVDQPDVFRIINL